MHRHAQPCILRVEGDGDLLLGAEGRRGCARRRPTGSLWLRHSWQVAAFGSCPLLAGQRGGGVLVGSPGLTGGCSRAGRSSPLASNLSSCRYIARSSSSWRSVTLCARLSRQYRSTSCRRSSCGSPRGERDALVGEARGRAFEKFIWGCNAFGQLGESPECRYRGLRKHVCTKCMTVMWTRCPFRVVKNCACLPQRAALTF